MEFVKIIKYKIWLLKHKEDLKVWLFFIALVVSVYSIGFFSVLLLDGFWGI